MNEMKPGCELDALIAKKVMDYTRIGDTENWRQHKIGAGTLEAPLPFFSKDISAAWEVVEKLKLFQIKQTNQTDGYSGYVQLWQDSDGPWTIGDWEDQLFILSKGETAAHAICVAALKTVGIKVEIQK